MVLALLFGIFVIVSIIQSEALSRTQDLGVINETLPLFNKTKVEETVNTFQVSNKRQIPRESGGNASASGMPSAINHALTVQITNASAVAGAAADVKNALEKVGYTVGTPTTSLKLSEDTVLRYKEGNEQSIKEIKEIVGDKFKVTREENTLTTKGVDVDIILGKTRK